MSKLYIILNQGIDLLAADSNGLSDPYTKIDVKIGSKKPISFKSKTIYKTLNPTWNEVYEVPHFTMDDVSSTSIKFNLWDWDMGFTHDNIGFVEISGSTLKSKIKMNQEISFKEKVQDPGTGFLQFSLKLSDSSQETVDELKKKASTRESKRTQDVDPDVMNEKLKSLEKSKK